MRIGEVEKITGISAQTIRYYESEGLLSVTRGENGYRDYDENTIEVLKGIRMARQLGISIADIRLWHNGVITLQELAGKRLQELSENDLISESQKDQCEYVLRNEKNLSQFDNSIFDDDNHVFLDDANENSAAVSDFLALGVDIGTTTVSAQIIDLKSGESVHKYSVTHNAQVQIDGYPGAFAMDANRLLDLAVGIVKSTCEAYPGLRSIGFTGQMHGIVFLDNDGECLTPLYTWQNDFGQLCNNGISFCQKIRDISGVSVASGYGLVTLYSMKQLGILPKNYQSISTIMDCAVMKLCGLNRPVTDETNAAGLGFFDLSKSSFMNDKLEMLGIDVSVLPKVAKGYSIEGYYRNIPVSVAIGDNQASVFGSLKNDQHFLINVGTSSQVSIIADSPKPTEFSEIRPYFDGKQIISCAALCGGAAYSALATFFQSVANEISGTQLTKNKVFAYMNRLALESLASNRGDSEVSPIIDTRLCGTRADAKIRGSVSNLSLTNILPENIIIGTLRGMIDELYQMYINASVNPKGRITAVVSGNAMRNCEALRIITEQIFGCKVCVPSYQEEASYGAGLYSAVSSGSIKRDEIANLIKYK